nr:protein PFC0760c-like [Onthophagus taurus]
MKLLLYLAIFYFKNALIQSLRDDLEQNLDLNSILKSKNWIPLGWVVLVPTKSNLSEKMDFSLPKLPNLMNLQNPYALMKPNEIHNDENEEADVKNNIFRVKTLVKTDDDDDDDDDNWDINNELKDTELKAMELLNLFKSKDFENNDPFKVDFELKNKEHKLKKLIKSFSIEYEESYDDEYEEIDANNMQPKKEKFKVEELKEPNDENNKGAIKDHVFKVKTIIDTEDDDDENIEDELNNDLELKNAELKAIKIFNLFLKDDFEKNIDNDENIQEPWKIDFELKNKELKVKKLIKSFSIDFEGDGEENDDYNELDDFSNESNSKKNGYIVHKVKELKTTYSDNEDYREIDENIKDESEVKVMKLIKLFYIDYKPNEDDLEIQVLDDQEKEGDSKNLNVETSNDEHKEGVIENESKYKNDVTRLMKIHMDDSKR